MMAFAIAALLVLPPVVLRRKTLLACYATYGAIALFAWILWRRVPMFDPHLGFAIVAVAGLVAFSLFLANGRDVKWSANRAALLAAIVYAAVIPAMLRMPIDGDEPFYLLITESLAGDADIDLANQYRDLARTASGRRDLVPQPGDPTGEGGAQYSRHEPFLPLLMTPGYALGGLPGAVAIVALFGVLLARSTVRWMEDEGIDDAAVRAVFPFFAFGPPVLFYATRIWPEVPAAFCYVEALRGVRNRRTQRWLPALIGLVLLKLRFVLVAIGLLGVLIHDLMLKGAAPHPPSAPSSPRGGEGTSVPLSRVRERVAGGRVRVLAIGAAVLALPMLIAFAISGNPLQVHAWRELLPAPPADYARGFFGLLADGASGIAFQAPFYLFGLFAITRWKTMPRGFRIGVVAPLVYIFYLLPRGEWFGGWAPPLRYLVFLMPVLALGAAAAWDRVSRGAIALAAAWTTGLVIHGLAYPWRLFHLANGENFIGEWFSRLYHTDFSRLFPSFIRLNDAAWIGAAVVVLLAIAGVRRFRYDYLVIPLAALALACGFTVARRPANVVHFEDAHVMHRGGALYPEQWTVYRVGYVGGWVLEEGDAMSFLARKGLWTLHYISGPGALIEVAGRAYQLPSTDRYASMRIEVPRGGRIVLRCLSGSVNLDRMTHE